TILIRHAYVRNNHIRLPLLYSLQCLCGRHANPHLRPAGDQNPQEQLAGVRLIVDNYNSQTLKRCRVTKRWSLVADCALVAAGVLLNGANREAHREGSAQPFARAVSPDGSAVQLNQLLDDCEPQSEPAEFSLACGRRLAEAIEYVRQKIRRDADA